MNACNLSRRGEPIGGLAERIKKRKGGGKRNFSALRFGLERVQWLEIEKTSVRSVSIRIRHATVRQNLRKIVRNLSIPLPSPLRNIRL